MTRTPVHHIATKVTFHCNGTHAGTPYARGVLETAYNHPHAWGTGLVRAA